jgi:hypothetical protein
MNEEMTGKCLRQVEHIRGHLWHRYSIAVNRIKGVSSNSVDEEQIQNKMSTQNIILTLLHLYIAIVIIFFNPRILNTQMKGKRFIQRNQFWNLQKTCNQKPQSNLYIKGHSGNLKMRPLWAVALYIPVKIIYAIL